MGRKETCTRKWCHTLAAFTIVGTRLNWNVPCTMGKSPNSERTFGRVRIFFFFPFLFFFFFASVQILYTNLKDSAIIQDYHLWCLPTKALHDLHPFKCINIKYIKYLYLIFSSIQLQNFALLISICHSSKILLNS